MIEAVKRRFVVTEIGDPGSMLHADLPCGVTCIPTFEFSGEAEAFRLATRETATHEWVVRPLDMKIGVPRE